jgi:sugar lactone lactonase YvrE
MTSYRTVSLEDVEVIPGFNGCECVALDSEGTVFGGDQDGVIRRTQPLENRLVVIDRETRETVPLVADPAGEKIVEPTNCAFGGSRFDELYIALRTVDRIARLQLDRSGRSLYDRQHSSSGREVSGA